MKCWCLQISQKDNQIFDRFLLYEARAEFCKMLVAILVGLKTSKIHSEINWPLGLDLKESNEEWHAVNDRKYVFHFRPKPNIWPEKHLALGVVHKLR